jgi:hypothetical protein
MQLEAVRVTQPEKHGPFQIRLKFGKRAYCVAEVSIGEEVAEVVRKLRETAAQGEARVMGGPLVPFRRPTRANLGTLDC